MKKYKVFSINYDTNDDQELSDSLPKTIVTMVDNNETEPSHAIANAIFEETGFQAFNFQFKEIEPTKAERKMLNSLKTNLHIKLKIIEFEVRRFLAEDGLTAETSQRVGLLNAIGSVESLVNGIEFCDLKASETLPTECA